MITIEKNPLQDIWDKALVYLQDTDMWVGYVFVFLKIVAIILVSRIVISIFNRLKRHMMRAREKSRMATDLRRMRTLGKLVSNVITYTINFVVILLILDLLNIPLAPFIASAGVIGLAVAFAAQSLVKDVITGFFIIFENQFAVGDTIQTGSFKGEVLEIGFRTTVIRSVTGEVHIVPNGSINQVTNFSVQNSIAVVDYTITNDMAFDVAIETIQGTVKWVFETYELLVTEPQLLGVRSVAGANVVLRITAECRANTHEQVAMILNTEIKRALDAKKKEIAERFNEL